MSLLEPTTVAQLVAALQKLDPTLECYDAWTERSLGIQIAPMGDENVVIFYGRNVSQREFTTS